MYPHDLKEMAEAVSKRLWERNMYNRSTHQNDVHDEVYLVLKAAWANKIALVWSIEDVLTYARSQGRKLTRDEADAVLQEVFRNHDCNSGVSWDTLDVYIAGKGEPCEPDDEDDEPEEQFFSVTLTREASESCEVIVQALDEDEAEERAQEAAGKYGENVGPWTLDEGNMHEAYIPDPNNVAEPHTGPVCQYSTAADAEERFLPLTWTPEAYMKGGTMHGHWMLAPALSDVVPDTFIERVNYLMVEGNEREGQMDLNTKHYTWKIHGDPTQPT